MRKDYIAGGHSGSSDETAFVEQFWTRNWQVAGGGIESRTTHFQKTLDRFKFKSEWRLMRRYLRTLNQGARILDGGCGTGEWCVFLNNLGYNTVGMDISRETVAKLDSIFPDGEFVHGDIRDTAQPDASFDAIYSWGTFEHFEIGLHPCIDEAFRLLRPGGLLFITVPFDSAGLSLTCLFDSSPTKPPLEAPRFFQWRLTRKELAFELTAGGFEVLATKPIHRRQSVVRMLHHGFGLNYDAKIVRLIGLVVGLALPRSLAGHMLMAVARKPF